MTQASRALCGNPSEVLLNALLAGLLAESRVPAGSIIDAGANDGEESCRFSLAARGRTVHAIDPLQQNVDAMRTRFASLPNLQPMLGGLGNRARTLHAPVKSTKASVGSQLFNLQSMRDLGEAELGQPFQVHRVDELFGSRWPTERLALAHIDVEGAELDVLHGANATIAASRPVLSLEVYPQTKESAARALLHALSELGYDAYLIDEVCGTPFDCRNLLCLPRESAAFLGSPVLDLAVGARRLFAVTPHNVGEYGFACCRRGGECCPRPSVCCHSRALIRRWIERGANATGVVLHPAIYTTDDARPGLDLAGLARAEPRRGVFALGAPRFGPHAELLAMQRRENGIARPWHESWRAG